MHVTADEARLLRETLGDEAAHLVITGSATRGGAKHDFARFTDEELFKVMRGLSVGIALTIGDLQGFAGKAAGIVAELRTRQLASATPTKVTVPPLQPVRVSRPSLVDPDGTTRRTYEQIGCDVQTLRAMNLTWQGVADALTKKGIRNSRGNAWTGGNLQTAQWTLAQKARPA